MYCMNCGKQIEDTARFCEHCGTPVGGVSPVKQEERKPKKKYGLLLLLGLLVVLAAGTAIYFLFFGKGEKGQAAEQLKLGNRYLEEMDYEQAVVAFTKTIEIDPQEVDAYIGASKAYAALESYWDAVMVLDAGYVETNAA